MESHNKIKRDLLISLGLGITILIVFCLAVSAGALQVIKLQPQPELQVKQGQSVFYEDGSVDLQPASKSGTRTLQTTVDGESLQGN
jgi:alpha-N-acetylglucosamine transferase